MKPTKKMTGRILILLMVSGLTLALVSWRGQQQNGKDRQAQNDTIPKKSSQPKDLDEVLAELEGLNLEETMKNARIEIEKAMKEIDTDKIRLEIDKAMKEVDFDKIQKQIEESIAKVDLTEMKAEMEKAMKEIDVEKLQAQIKESFREVDMEKIKKEMEKVRDIDMKKLEADLSKMKEELKDIGPRIDKELANAKVEIEKAKVEIKEFKGFVDGLEKDGLISKKEGFTLKHENGELFINGKKASEQVYNRYRDFLQKHKKFNMVQNDKDFDLDKD